MKFPSVDYQMWINELASYLDDAGSLLQMSDSIDDVYLICSSVKAGQKIIYYAPPFVYSKAHPDAMHESAVTEPRYFTDPRQKDVSLTRL